MVAAYTTPDVLHELDEELLRLALERVGGVGVEDVHHAPGHAGSGDLVDHEHVGRRAAGGVVVAQDVLHARDRALVGLLGELDHRGPGLLRAAAHGGELVDAAERGLRVARGELGAHAKGVDRRALCEERLDRVLVEVVGDRDLDVGKAGLVEGGARLLG